MTTPQEFGRIGGKPVEAVTLENRNGLRARLISYGARLTELWVPDRNGEMADIVLGFDDLDSYIATDTYFGATCGRYGNRITDGRFSLDGETFQLDVNEAPNTLHGGSDGFDRRIWDLRLDGNSAEFTTTSDDGDMGFPGRLDLATRYELTDDDRLRITMRAKTDRATPLNMVHHSYFNLAGQGSGDVLGQQLRLNARFYTPVDAALMPTGEIRATADTPYHFAAAKPIGAEIDAPGPGGYDHNWCLDGSGAPLRLCADAFDPASGRRMVLHTSEPGVQFYTGGYLSDTITGKSGKPLCKFAGFTLESQKFPDSPNHAHFPNCILRPGETYDHRMDFTFPRPNP